MVVDQGAGLGKTKRGREGERSENLSSTHKSQQTSGLNCSIVIQTPPLLFKRVTLYIEKLSPQLKLA